MKRIVVVGALCASSVVIGACGSSPATSASANGAPQRSGSTTTSSPAPSSTASATPPTTGSTGAAAPPSSAAPGPASSASGSICTTPRLQISAGTPRAAAGNDGVAILFLNVGSSSCTIGGYPGVAGLDATGHQLTQAQRTLSGYLGGATSVSSFQLGPGQTASALVEGTSVPSGSQSSCTSYASLLVTPPNNTQSVIVHVSLPACSGLQVHPTVDNPSGSSS